MRSMLALLLPLALLAGCAAPSSSPAQEEDTAQEGPQASASPDDTDGTLFDQTLSVTVDGRQNADIGGPLQGDLHGGLFHLRHRLHRRAGR